jgi:hypothetical protein
MANDAAMMSSAISARGSPVISPWFLVTPNRRFQFDKRRQLFIGTHNETLSVIARIALESFLIAGWKMMRP